MAVSTEQDSGEKESLPATRWGFWATLAFSAVIAVIYMVAQGFAIGLMLGMEYGISAFGNEQELLESAIHNGFYLSVGIILSAWVGSLVIGAIVLIRKGITLKEYLAVKNISFKTYALWMAFVLVYLFVWQGLSMVLEHSGSEWMAKTYQTAEYLPLLWIALVIAAPLVEELFFRGFLFEGLRDSWMGSTGAVLVTSIGWAAIHMQYELFQLVMLGTLGILLGIAKLKTRSLYIPIAMHAFNNLLALIATSLYLDN